MAELPPTSPGYEFHPDDNPTPELGELLLEAGKRLSRRPDIMERMKVFINMWGMDAYDPHSDDGCSIAVRQMVICALRDAQYWQEQSDG